MTERKLDLLCYRELDWLIICLPYPSRFQDTYIHTMSISIYIHIVQCIEEVQLCCEMQGMDRIHYLFWVKQLRSFRRIFMYLMDEWFTQKIIGLNTKKHFKLWILIWKAKLFSPAMRILRLLNYVAIRHGLFTIIQARNNVVVVIQLAEIIRV